MNCYVMIGMPGSGKSTYASNLAKKTGAVLLSTDDIAFEIYGHNNFRNGKEVFKELRRRALIAVGEGKDVIFDCTNLSISARRKRIMFGKLNHCKVIGIYINTPFEECLKRNASRERQLTTKRMHEVYADLVEPSKDEGFDELIIVE